VKKRRKNKKDACSLTEAGLAYMKERYSEKGNTDIPPIRAPAPTEESEGEAVENKGM
jgi:hypothetical protein